MKKIILLLIFLFPLIGFTEDGMDIRMDFSAIKCTFSDNCTSKSFLTRGNNTHIPYNYCDEYRCLGNKVFTFLFDDIFFFTKIEVTFEKTEKTYSFRFVFGGNHIKFDRPVSNDFYLNHVPGNFSYYEMTGDKMKISTETNYYKGAIIIEGNKGTPPDSLY